jgi:hypothetical protein
MTVLEEWLEKGYDVKISDKIEEDSVFVFENLRVVHPVTYSYISNDDIFKAHEINMLRIYDNIEQAAEKACAKIDRMVDEMNMRGMPKMIMFHAATRAVENEDGSYSFYVDGEETIPVPDRMAPYVEHFLKEYT